MKLTTTLTSLAVLAALVAFLVTPVVAEDEVQPSVAPGAGETPPARPDCSPRDLHPILASDADRDGSVSAEEWKTFLASLTKRFEVLDENGDGALAADELPERPRGPGMRGPHRRGPRRGGPDMHAQRGPDMRGQRGPRMHGPDARGQRGPGMRGAGPRGQGPRGPDARAPQGDADLGARLDRLTSALERLLERMESENR